MSDELLSLAQAVFRPDLYDAALGAASSSYGGEPRDGIGALSVRILSQAILPHILRRGAAGAQNARVVVGALIIALHNKVAGCVCAKQTTRLRQVDANAAI